MDLYSLGVVAMAVLTGLGVLVIGLEFGIFGGK